MRQFPLLILFLFILSCQSKSQTTEKPKESAASHELLDSILIVQTLKTLSSDEFEGRKNGTKGYEKAQKYIIQQFKELGLKKFGNDYHKPFPSKISGKTVQSSNLVGYLEGTENPSKYIVIGAHYDHVGIKNGEVYNGADDNASGIGGILGMAKYFSQNPPKHSIIFMAFDAEEVGLQGSRYIAKNSPVSLKDIVFMVNMDMIAQNQEGEIYASGTYHNPFLKPLIKKINQENPTISILLGHDEPKTLFGPQDWTHSSDHYAFHQAGIPYIYFGVEDHPHYHKPTDDFERINLSFYLDAVDMILDTIKALDQHLLNKSE